MVYNRDMENNKILALAAAWSERLRAGEYSIVDGEADLTRCISELKALFSTPPSQRMTPQRFNQIEALGFEMLDETAPDIEQRRAVYNALRDCLLALLPQVQAEYQTTHDPRLSEMRCGLPPLH